MQVDLRTLQPNPYRDFTIDPMDEEVVEALRHSIEEDGFWGGIVCRQTPNGTIQIGAGHHRVQAALEAGITSADVFVGRDMDDVSIIRVYARENATQRGNTSSALAGTIASAVRCLLKDAFTEGTILTGLGIHKPEVVRQGVGGPTILKFLPGIPGIHINSVQHQLANLKASGHYARILQEVQEEIEQEQREAEAALEAAEREQERLRQEREEAEEQARIAEAERREAATRARKARQEADRRRAEEATKAEALARDRARVQAELAAKRRAEAEEQQRHFDQLRQQEEVQAPKRQAAAVQVAKAAQKAHKLPKTFDFEGVARHLKNAHQIDVFREQVTSNGIAELLPVDQQAALAERLVEAATRTNRGETSGAFIRSWITTELLQARSTFQTDLRHEQEQLAEQDKVYKAQRLQDDMVKYLRLFVFAGTKLHDLWKTWPAGLTFPENLDFRNALASARRIFDQLDTK